MSEQPRGNPLGEVLSSLRSDTSGDPHRFEEVQARVGEVVEALGEVRSGSYRGGSADDLVLADVDGQGTLVNLEISPYAMRDLDAAALSAACGEAIVSARTALAEEFRGTFAAMTDLPTDELPTSPDPMQVWQQAQERAGWTSSSSQP